MIGLEVIKQSFENNKKGISTDLLKRIASLKIEEKFQNCLTSYSIISLVERIAESRIDEENKKTLMKILKDGLNKTVSEMEDSVKELDGSKEEHKEEHKEEQDSEEHKEEPKQDNSENGLEGPRETPAENVINNNDENDHRVIFNY